MRTPPPPIDVEHVFPDLRGTARQTVRLHPRPAALDPGLGLSKLGGLLLWPEDEPWPTCPAPEEQPVDTGLGPPADVWSVVQLDLSELPVGHKLHNDHLVGVLQLRLDDVPELGFYPGTDLFQLLWCPRGHPDEYGPYCRVFWRRTADVLSPLAHAPEPSRPDGELLPPTCILAPERVVEFPPRWLLPDDLDDRIREWEASAAAQGVSYHFQLSTAPGTKVGGYADRPMAGMSAPAPGAVPRWSTC
jgi:hypothetical protein